MTSMTLKPMHPGEVLREEFMKPLGLSAYRSSTRPSITKLFKKARVE